MIEIRETTKRDLALVKILWADGDVMRFVGFPEGLHQTDEYMMHWFEWIVSSRPATNHYSIFSDEVYCGETFFSLDSVHKSASLDIKLFRFARGKGIAAAALSFAMKEAFKNGARSVWVDPNPQNSRAIALYQRLGFKKKQRPPYLEEASSIYMECTCQKGQQANCSVGSRTEISREEPQQHPSKATT